jgi:hypothetical protein
MSAEKKLAAALKIKYPKKLGDCIDLAFKLRSERLELEKQVAEKKALEDAAKEHLLTEFKDDAINGARGKTCLASLVIDEVPQIDPDNGGWPAFYEYLKKTGEFELLEKRLGKLAAQERWEAGKSIPGVKKFINKKINLTQGK